MFSTGEFTTVPPAPCGNKGFEMKTRNLMPLGLWVVVLLDELLPPQEIMLTLTATSTRMLLKILFKPGTPKGMKDKDLDARKRIITERLRRICPLVPSLFRRHAKATFLLYSEQNGY